MEVEGITDEEVAKFRQELSRRLRGPGQVSDAVAQVYAELTEHCPEANPSDLWQHVIYRHLLTTEEWSDQQWKRVSGFALERALVAVYQPRLARNGMRMRIMTKSEANAALTTMGIKDIRSTKVDLFIEGLAEMDDRLFGRIDTWAIFGAAHVKSSIAERIQDDVPASRAFMDLGLTSIAITMDAKGYPPPHGDCINYGELGGRSVGVDKDRLKRRYVEVDGQFDALFSFNLRTPPSKGPTESGKRIYTMGLHEKEPDQLVRFLTDQWHAYAERYELRLAKLKR